MFDGDYPEGIFEYIAMGRWIVKQPFLVASIGMHSQMAKSTTWARKLAEFEIKSFESHQHGDLLKDISAFMGYQLSRKVSKDQQHLYKISAAFGDSLFDLGV